MTYRRSKSYTSNFKMSKKMLTRDSLASTGSKKSSYWDASLSDNDATSRVMAEVAAKKEIRNARLLFEASTQSNPPSKDFVSILITENGIIWSKWKITLRGYTSGCAPVPQPQEDVMSITDFKCNDSLMVSNTIRLYCMRYFSCLGTTQFRDSCAINSLI